jgi:hypothetical protein
LDAAVDIAQAVAVGGLNISHQLLKSPSTATDEASDIESLRQKSQDLRNYCESHAVDVTVGTAPPTGVPPTGESTRTADHEKILRDVAAAQARLEATERQILAMEARLGALNDSAGRALERIEQTVAQQSDFVRGDLSKKTAEIEKGLTEALRSIEIRAEGFESYEKKAESILDAMSNRLLVTGYAASSGQEERSANFFRFLSIALMALTFWILTETLYTLSESPADWKDAIVRVVVSLILTVPTAYLAREAGRHRAHAVELRKTSLDFLALNPYLAEIQKAEARDELKVELAKRIFFADKKIEGSDLFPLDTQALAMKALDIAVEAVKRKPTDKSS